MNGAFWTQKNYGVQISSKIWNPFVTDGFPYETLILRRRCLFCTRSVSNFCRKPLYFLAHAMWVKWWYHDNLEPFQSSFQMLLNFMVLWLKIISKCMKNNKWSQKGLEIDYVALNGAFWTQKNDGSQISSKKWNPFVTHEFPYETLVLRRRLSVLYTKCIQFLP